MGVSMGGMIVQQLAIHHRERLLTMTSVMSRTGEPGYGDPTPEAWALLTAPGPPTAKGRCSATSTACICGAAPSSRRGSAGGETARRPTTATQTRPVSPASSSRSAPPVRGPNDLPGVTTPSLVIHGDKDTLIDISGGRRTAALIPGAKFVEIKGMGHDYPPELWDRLVSEIATFCLGV